MKTFILAVIVVCLGAVSAQDKKKTETKPDKRLYTEEEFQKAVLEEVDRYLQKAGNNKLVDFSKELVKKDQDLRLKEIEIDKMKQELSHNQESFKKKVIEFQKRQELFIGCIDGKQDERNKRITHMVDVISAMRPQNAADVLSVQDADISVQILEKLDPTKISKIFNSMDKEISARLQKQFMNMKK
ncbi:MAG: hypothetical protein EP326_05485 [Deltaproteobacteria bacterium]|nr:MAG: hypothetical protein EP326_05485 [Deltaproteobacteria bacterium]TNF31743.1 MAG: hypothetical protein EP319_01280 [Deltaproteobacteria bacterium]